MLERHYNLPVQHDYLLKVNLPEKQVLSRLKVFISHSFDDKDLAYNLKEILMKYGIIECYLVEDHFDPTKPPVVKIRQEISNSDYLVAIITDKAKKSASVGFEIGYANAKHVPIIMMLEDKIEPPVTVIKEGIVFTRNNFEESCKRARTFLFDSISIKIKEIQNGKILRLVKDDITERQVDVIVNSANSYLKNSTGRAKNIVRKGGYVIQKECDKIEKPVPVGSAVITTSGRLSCKKIIHTIGPRMGEGGEDSKLKRAVINSLSRASENGFRSISMPAISSGVRGFPKDRCAEILVTESIKFLSSNPKTTLEIIEFCSRNYDTFRHFSKHFQ